MRKRICILFFAVLLAGCHGGVRQRALNETEGGMSISQVKPTVHVTYETVTPDGILEIQCESGKGIKLDLNNDGMLESVYVSKEGIYINDIRQELNYSWETYESYSAFNALEPWEQYWIVDVDTTDAYLNLIFYCEQGGDDAETLVYYDEKIKEIGVLETFGGNSGFSSAEYQGDGTFIVKTREQNLMSMVFYAPVMYKLDENGKMLQAEEFVALSEPYPLQLLETIMMYTEHMITSDSFAVEPQRVFALVASDNWIKFSTEDGREGWVYVEYIPEKGYIVNQQKRSEEFFDGFSNAG